MDRKKVEPIRRRKLSHEVRDRLIRMIESGEFQPGDQMPSENELMTRFQVGRPAVREALQALANMGLLSIHHGARATLRSPTAREILEQVDLATRHLLMISYDNVQHLREARQVFETGVVKLACQKASREDIEQLGVRLQKMRDNIANRRKFRQADQEFHIMLADMTKNPIIASVSRAMLKWLQDYHECMLGVAGLEELTLKEHTLIFEHIQAGDAEKACQEVSDHILRANAMYPKNDSDKE